MDTHIVRPERQERRGPGPAGRLARLAARTAWDRIAPGVDATRLRDAFLHQAGEGFLEPAAGRYLIDYGGYAETRIHGRHFGGPSGHPLQARHRQRRPPGQAHDPLGLLRLLSGAADAQRAGDEMLRETLGWHDIVQQARPNSWPGSMMSTSGGSRSRTAQQKGVGPSRRH